MFDRLITGVLLAAALAPAAFAADDDGAWREEMQSLERQVRDLKARLAARDRIDDRETAPPIEVGGALRFQLQRRGGDANDRATAGEIDIDTIRVNFDGEVDDILFSAEYRFYPTFDNAHFIHHGWLGYRFTGHWYGRLGIMQVPFGIQPYASHNFFFSSNYYLGLEDDYDAGASLRYTGGPHDLRLAFFKNDEYAGGGGFKRYSYDPLNIAYRGTVGGEQITDKVAIEEANTLNLRYAYTVRDGAWANSELGVSIQAGQIYNGLTQDTDGEHWAGALHLNAHRGPWNLMLQTARYEIDSGLPDTRRFEDAMDNAGTLRLKEDIVGTGAYAFEYTLPATAWSYVLNLAYTRNVSLGPITALTYYNDFSYVDKDDRRLGETVQNVTGVSILAGAIFTYVDFVLGKNQPFTNRYVRSGGFDGAQMTDLGSASANEWNTRFNINVGYYF